MVFTLGLGACASIPENVGRTESYAYQDTGDTSLGLDYERRSGYHPGETIFRYIDNGLDAFVARAKLANIAERSIDTQYYMIHDDTVGLLFLNSLYRAAERGIRVRLLIDDIGQEGRDSGVAIIDAHPNMPRQKNSWVVIGTGNTPSA